MEKGITDNTHTCPICGNAVPVGELFCAKCGMRIHIHSLDKSNVANLTSHNINGSKEQTFHNFREWCDYWADLYVANHDFWVYLISEHIDNADFELPILVCAHEFSTQRAMQDAYNYLCQNEKDFGYGVASDSVFMCKDDNHWYVFLDCCDLPFVLLVADYFRGSLCAWADHFIQLPPMPIRAEKSIGDVAYKGTFAPVKAKRQVLHIRDVAQKHHQSNMLKPIIEVKRDVRSIYLFLHEKDYNDAKNAIWYGNYDIHEKLDWYGDSSAYGYSCCWVVRIFDNLTQEELEWTVSRIREHGGQFYRG